LAEIVIICIGKSEIIKYDLPVSNVEFGKRFRIPGFKKRVAFPIRNAIVLPKRERSPYELKYYYLCSLIIVSHSQIDATHLQQLIPNLTTNKTTK
jgi:hypothetical protein